MCYDHVEIMVKTDGEENIVTLMMLMGIPDVCIRPRREMTGLKVAVKKSTKSRIVKVSTILSL